MIFDYNLTKSEVNTKNINVETIISDYDCFPSSFSGGTWVNARPEVLKDILKFFLSENSLSPNTAVFITKNSPSDFSYEIIGKKTANNSLPVIELYTFFLPSNHYCDIPVLKSDNSEPISKTTAIIKDFSFKEIIPEKYHEDVFFNNAVRIYNLKIK